MLQNFIPINAFEVGVFEGALKGKKSQQLRELYLGSGREGDVCL